MTDAADADEPVPPPRGDRPRLTARERDVLRASATGRSTAEVADLLGLSPEVARAAIASAIAKLGAGSKLEAVIVAARRGLISVPP
jgi:DNA-binding CsgD family transcriptional regulator